MKSDDAFVHGLNTEQFQELLATKYRLIRDPVMVSWDTTAFDSSQTFEHLRVDDMFHKLVMDQVLIAMESVPYSHKHLLKPFLKSRAKHFVSYYPERMSNKKRRVLMRGQIDGTVTSGDPIATTLGNTIRMKFYALFIAYLAGLDPVDVSVLAAGDDCKVIIARDSVDRFLCALKAVYSSVNTDATHGLGMCIKSVNVSGTVIDMLSKTGVIHNGVALAHRQFLKAILSGNITDKVREGFSVIEHRTAIT